LIENHPCLCREELERCEGQYIRAEPNAVNKYIAGRTKTEYYQDNVETIKAQQKRYNQDNAEAIKAQKRQYDQANAIRASQKQDCPCGGRFTHGAKLRHMRTKKHQIYVNQE
jgi:hypothetical protein